MMSKEDRPIATFRTYGDAHLPSDRREGVAARGAFAEQSPANWTRRGACSTRERAPATTRLAFLIATYRDLIVGNDARRWEEMWSRGGGHVDRDYATLESVRNVFWQVASDRGALSRALMKKQRARIEQVFSHCRGCLFDVQNVQSRRVRRMKFPDVTGVTSLNIAAIM